MSSCLWSWGDDFFLKRISIQTKNPLFLGGEKYIEIPFAQPSIIVVQGNVWRTQQWICHDLTTHNFEARWLYQLMKRRYLKPMIRSQTHVFLQHVSCLTSWGGVNPMMSDHFSRKNVPVLNHHPRFLHSLRVYIRNPAPGTNLTCELGKQICVV